MKLSNAQKIALNLFLFDYPLDLDFETILQKVNNNGEEDSDIIISILFEKMNRSAMAICIEELSLDIQKALDEPDIHNTVIYSSYQEEKEHIDVDNRNRVNDCA